MKYNLVVVTGPTASGKTAFAAHLAHRLEGEIISADSRQVYKGMDLGTGKDYADYHVQGRRIPAHLLDIMPAGERYDVYHFQQDACRLVEDIRSRGRWPVVCGGTGMYIEAVAGRYQMHGAPENPQLRDKMRSMSFQQLLHWYHQLVPNPHNTTDTRGRQRLERAIEIATQAQEQHGPCPDIKPLILVVYFDREIQKKRIYSRLLKRLEGGMLDEVRQLKQAGLTREDMEYYGLEYRYINRYLNGGLAYGQMVEQLNVAIRQFAKRQMTWFRRMGKKGHSLHWIPGEWPLDDKLHYALKQLQ